MRGNKRDVPGRKLNPLRDAMRERQRAERLKSELPSLIEDQVDEHIRKLESKLLDDFRRMGRRAIEESTAVINEQLHDRIETLEEISSLQSRTLTNLRDSSKIAEQKVSSVVNSIEKTLSDAVPGFRLEASQFAPPLPGEPGAELIPAEPHEVDGVKGRYGFCPNCTSTDVRRAYRHGLWEQFLRLFFIAPFRCRACRHKFYRF